MKVRYVLCSAGTSDIAILQYTNRVCISTEPQFIFSSLKLFDSNDLYRKVAQYVFQQNQLQVIHIFCYYLKLDVIGMFCEVIFPIFMNVLLNFYFLETKLCLNAKMEVSQLYSINKQGWILKFPLKWNFFCETVINVLPICCA